MDIRINDKYQEIDGFTAQEGFILFYDQDELKGISSGWHEENALMVYTKNGKKWKGDWYFEKDNVFPVSEAVSKQTEWNREQDFQYSVEDAKGKGDLYLGDSFEVATRLTTEGPRKMYGTIAHYTKTDVPGVYKHEISSDPNSGRPKRYWGYEVLTNDKVKKIFEIERELKARHANREDRFKKQPNRSEHQNLTHHDGLER